MHSSCTQPRAGAHQAAAHSACTAFPHPLAFELEPTTPDLYILTWLEAHPSTAGQRWVAQAGLGWAAVCTASLVTLPNPRGLEQGELGQPPPSLGDE